MTSQAEPPRYEVKIPCEPRYLPQVEAWVQLHPAHWRVAYPPRQVNNIYFDTVDCQSLNDNLGGVGSRGKLRLRWYGPCLETVTEARLELKRREGNVSWKEIWPFAGRLDLAHLSWAQAYRILREAADARPSLWLSQFGHPALVNHYQRAYYVTADQTVRLTVDTGLRTYNQRFSDLPNLQRPALIVEYVVVELKAAADHQSYRRLAEALIHFPLRPDRYSKYVQGMLSGPDFDGVKLL